MVSAMMDIKKNEPRVLVEEKLPHRSPDTADPEGGGRDGCGLACFVLAGCWS